MTKNALLNLKNVKVHFPLVSGFFKKSTQFVKAVDGVSFDIYKGDSVGLVGESGSGKTTLSRSILGLIDEIYNHKHESEIIYNGKNILDMDRKELNALCRHIQIIFQDPFESLNPRMSIGKIIEEGIAIHSLYPKNERMEKVKEILNLVGLDADYYYRYPHEFSGGQRQRIGIARALVLNPDFIIADEPVSALDVSIQVQILKLMQKMKEEFSLTYLFVAHDLSVVDYFCDRIVVMYLGKIMEIGTNEQIISNAKHPYTKALLSAVPIPDPENEKEQIILEGDIPDPINPPAGCVFKTRCPKKMKECDNVPPEIEIETGHIANCWLYENRKKT